MQIIQSNVGNSEFQDSNYPQYGSFVRYNPSSRSPFQGRNYVGLGHELVHTRDRFNGNLDMNTWQTVTDQNGNQKSIPYAEVSATHTENQIRAENGLPLRTHYTVDANGNGTGTRIIYNRTRQSRYYNSNGVTNPNYRPISRRKNQIPFTY